MMRHADSLWLELTGGAPRAFTSVAHVLFWLAAKRGRRTGLRGTLASEAGAPMSDAARASSDATYGRVAACLAARDEADWDSRTELAESAIEALLAYYEVMFGEYADQADEYSAKRRVARAWAAREGIAHADPWPAFCRTCRETRNVLRRRFEARGLFDEEEEERVAA